MGDEERINVDPTTVETGPDPEEVVEETLEEEDVDFGAFDGPMFVDEEEPADEPEEEEVDEPEEEVVEEPVAQPKSVQERLQESFTQEELNQIFGQARIKGREYEDSVRLIEQQTGMPIGQVVEVLRNQEVERYENEYGMPKEEAKRIAEALAKVPYLENNLQTIWQQQQQTRMLAAYQNDKARFLNNPEVRRYEAEIDAVSQGGQRLGFEAAMYYVLGQRAYQGDIQRAVKDSTQQQTLKNVNKRSTISPVNAGAGGSPAKSIPKELRGLASALGNDASDVFNEYQKIQKQQQRKP